MTRSSGRLATLAGAILPALVLAGAGWLAWWLLSTAPRQEKTAPQRLVPTVEVVPIVLAERPVSIEAHGTVAPARRVSLAPEVEGRVVAMSPSLAPGALLREGDVVLRIDPSDARLRIAAAEAQLAMAEADLELERGRGLVAQREWERFGDGLETVDQDERSATLALRAPQLARAEAEVASARNAVDEAHLALERCELRAPFDAVVLSESVEIGRRMGPQTEAVELAGIDTFWVTASVPLGRASRLPDEASPDADLPVEVVLDTGLGDGVRMGGRFLRRLPDLESEGRMARVLVAVDDPLGVRDGRTARLPVGAYVRVLLQAGRVADVLEAPREALRENDRVWVRDREGRLRFRPVEVVWRSAESVLVRGAFEDGDALVTSYLSDPLPGIVVEARRADGPSDDAEPDEREASTSESGTR